MHNVIVLQSGHGVLGGCVNKQNKHNLTKVGFLPEWRSDDVSMFRNNHDCISRMSSADESQPLLGNNLESAGQSIYSHSSDPREEFSKERSTDVGKKCCFLVEIVVVIYFLCEYPFNLVAQKYIIDRFTVHHMERDALLNISHGNQTISPCDVNISSSDYAFQQGIQRDSSLFIMTQTFVWSIPAILVTLSLGASSDTVGRRLAILPPLLGILCTSSVLGIVSYFRASIYWLFIGDVLYGCGGSLAAVMMGSLAFVVDQCEPSNRMYRITIVQICLAISSTISPIVVGPLLAMLGVTRTVCIIAMLAALNLVYSLICLPNSGKRTRQAQTILQLNNNKRGDEDEARTEDYSQETAVETPSANCCSCNLLSQLKIAFLLFKSKPACSCIPTSNGSCTTRSCPSRRRLSLNLLLACFLLTTIPTFDVIISILFEMNSPLCWPVNIIGIYTGMSLGISAVGAVVFAPLLKRFLANDTIAIVAGLACTGNRVYLYFVKNSIMMFCGRFVIFHLILKTSHIVRK